MHKPKIRRHDAYVSSIATMGKKKGGSRRDDDDPFADLGEDVTQNNLQPEEPGNKTQESVPNDASNESEGSGAPEKQDHDATPASAGADAGGGGGGAAMQSEPEPPRLLTKKEKERLKKEREKEKKKAQAAQKKASQQKDTQEAPSEKGTNAPGSATQPNASEPTDGSASTQADAKISGDDKGGDADAAAGKDDEDDDEGAEAPSSAADKKKKKKKKKAAPEPAAAPPKKAPNAAIAALQARIAAQKKAEEQARAEEEERRRLIEEEERKEREEEERKEAERLRRKEKEKAKREQLRKEGKLLTPKQKAELKQAEARKAALLASGNISVAAHQAPVPAEKTRRVVYDNKKKKSQKKQEQEQPEQEQEQDAKSTAATAPEHQAEPEPPTAPASKEDEKQSAEDDDVKDDWEAESDDVKDDWEQESEEEEDANETPSKGGAPAKDTSAPADRKVEKENVGQAQTPATSGTNKEKEENGEQDDHDDKEDDDDDDHDDDDDEEDDEEDDDDDDLTKTQRMALERRQAAEQRRKERTEKALAERSADHLRSPICCILGHVDTGKTKLLDKVRQTSVQEGEAGGITQQIGATYFPVDALKEKTFVLNKGEFDFKVPGLLIIDTPGHESFTNLRSRGSSLCNIAILVVDIMHGLEAQTLESLRLLRDRKTPFIVALNKIDRLYDWKATPNNAVQDSLAQQAVHTQNEFDERVSKILLAFNEQGLNAELYYRNKNMGRYVSLVPTSAHTGEGVPDLLQLLVSLTQTRMSRNLMYLSELECTVLEVKVIEGLGTTIDVVLSNGVLREGDKIVVCGLNGPIVTQVRALLTPQPLKELRVRGAYVHHKEVKASLGVKIAAPDLEKAVAGSRLLVCTRDDEEELLREEVMSDLTTLLNSVDKSGKGVCVQASTLGSLEALLEFLRVSKIPVSGINIGPVYKRDVMRCATMLEKARELACILCFDVPVDKEAERLADELGVKLFTADIIYHLFDSFMAYSAEIMESKKRDAAGTAVWPCRLRTIAAFAKRDPIILGCDIVDGSLRIGTPLCVVKADPSTRKKEIVPLGRVSSLEINHKPRNVVLKKDVGAGVAVRIDPDPNEAPKMFGRHLDEKDEIYSYISRSSIDALKEHFWDGVSIEEKRLIKNLKGLLDIP